MFYFIVVIFFEFKIFFKIFRVRLTFRMMCYWYFVIFKYSFVNLKGYICLIYEICFLIDF